MREINAGHNEIDGEQHMKLHSHACQLTSCCAAQFLAGVRGPLQLPMKQDEFSPQLSALSACVSKMSIQLSFLFSIQHTKVKKRPGNSPFCVMCQRSGLNYPLRSSFQGTWLTAEVSPPAPFTSLGLLMNRLFIQNRFLFRYRWFTILYNF